MRYLWSLTHWFPTQLALAETRKPSNRQLLRDKDPLLRYGGVYTLALAYVATSNNSAIRRLLHLAVSGALAAEIMMIR